jgi:hypothetical protein
MMRVLLTAIPVGGGVAVVWVARKRAERRREREERKRERRWSGMVPVYRGTKCERGCQHFFHVEYEEGSVRDMLAREAAEAEERADAEERGEIAPAPGQRGRSGK